MCTGGLKLMMPDESCCHGDGIQNRSGGVPFFNHSTNFRQLYFSMPQSSHEMRTMIVYISYNCFEE